MATDRDQPRNAVLSHPGAQIRMLRRGHGAELEHVTQDGPGVSARSGATKLTKGLDRRAHRVGIGVVGVVDHQDAIRP
jgi:hypothetical protein